MRGLGVIVSIEARIPSDLRWSQSVVVRGCTLCRSCVARACSSPRLGTAPAPLSTCGRSKRCWAPWARDCFVPKQLGWASDLELECPSPAAMVRRRPHLSAAVRRRCHAVRHSAALPRSRLLGVVRAFTLCTLVSSR